MTYQEAIKGILEYDAALNAREEAPTGDDYNEVLSFALSVRGTPNTDDALRELRECAATIADHADSDDIDAMLVQEFTECAPAVVALCDAYARLRTDCPVGAVVVTAAQDIDGNAAEYFDDDGEPTTLFDKVTGALEFCDIGALVGTV